MSFNYSFSVGYLAQTNVYRQNSEGSVISRPNTDNISGNIKVTLYPRWYKHVVVDWSIPADWGKCLFNVYFGPTSEGPFARLNPAPLEGNYLSDINTQEYSKFNKGFYIVEAILQEKNNVSIKSKAKSWDTVQTSWVQLRSQEVQRREWWLLNKFVGTKTYLFRKMTYGERCPECWNKKVQKVMKDNCKTCLGTSFKGGYFPCYPTYVQYDPSPDSNIKSYFTLFEPNQLAAWTISVPEILPDDILIRHGEWDLYRVENTARTELQAKLVRQMLQVTELSKHSIEYELLTKNIPEFPAKYT